MGNNNKKQMKGFTQKIPAINPSTITMSKQHKCSTHVVSNNNKKQMKGLTQKIPAINTSTITMPKQHRCSTHVVSNNNTKQMKEHTQKIPAINSATNEMSKQQKFSAHVAPNDNTKEMREHTQKIPAINPSTKIMSKQQCSTHVEEPSRRVTFHSSVKSWDGPREQNILLERLVHEYFQKNRCVDLLSKLLRNRRQKQLSQLCTMLRALLKRLAVQTRTPLLPGGGGKGIIIPRTSFRAVAQLSSLTSSVHGHCSKFRTLSGKHIL